MRPASLALAGLLSLASCTHPPSHLEAEDRPEEHANPESSESGAPRPEENDRTAELNEMFAAADPDDSLVLAPGTYVISDYLLLPSSPGVTINAKDAVFRGRSVILGAETIDLTWIGGEFLGDGSNSSRISFNLFGGRDLTFDGLTFDGALPFGNHAFDLLGTQNIEIQDLTISGYGNQIDVDHLPPHSVLAEAVQLDHASRDGIGLEETVQLLESMNVDFDGRAAKDVSVTNSIFQAKYSEDGRVIAWAPSPFGNHSPGAAGKHPESLKFQGNLVIDPIPMSPASDDYSGGVLHFDSVDTVSIAGNWFQICQAEAPYAWIEFRRTEEREPSGQPHDESYAIDSNTFVGPEPERDFIVSTGYDRFVVDRDLDTPRNRYFPNVEQTSSTCP